jgi:hypothetical protein
VNDPSSIGSFPFNHQIEKSEDVVATYFIITFPRKHEIFLENNHTIHINDMEDPPPKIYLFLYGTHHWKPL